jgi:hypothetical protein
VVCFFVEAKKAAYPACGYAAHILRGQHAGARLPFSKLV